MKSKEEKEIEKQIQAEREKEKAKVKELIEAKGIKDMKDIDEYMGKLMENMIQVLMDGEFEAHMGYEKNKQESKDKENYRNGYSSKEKEVRTKYGKMKISTPRDRKGEFEPMIVPKRARVLDGIEDMIISMMAKGMSLGDTKNVIKDIYKIEMSTQTISLLTERVNEEVEKWRGKELESIYAIVYIDCMYVKIKEECKSRQRPIYVVVGINMEGEKDILGIYIGDSEGETGRYWREVLEDLKERGVKDILYVCFDGLPGLDEIVREEYNQAQTQRCIVHIVRNLYKRCAKGKRKEVIEDFKKIYTSSLREYAEEEYKKFLEKYKEEKTIIKYVRENIEHIYSLYEYTEEIRKLIYTTNTIESVNSSLRKVTRGKGTFVNEMSVMKVMYLRVKELKEKWAKKAINWKQIKVQLYEMYGERIKKAQEI